ncbi:MAG: ABC transporter permease [Betaproteobacteria bacterium]|nr:ABC transporter permease [Betaproteobacteria bacterium]
MMSSQSTRPSNFALALKDLREGIGSIYLWPMLGWQEIRQRYRRSVLGPFWITISTGAMIAGMGPLYGRLFGLDISTYIPYLTVSFVTWLLIANLINDCCGAFINAEGFIKQIKLPLTVHILRVVWRNLIIFTHNLLIVILVLAFYKPPVGWVMLLIPLAVLVIAINGVWIGLLFGLLCARFRDIPLVVGSVVQVAFFLTPVMWKADTLGKHKWAADVNPFYHFLEIARAPVVSGTAGALSWVIVLAITITGFVLTLAVFSRYRARIAYWV